MKNLLVIDSPLGKVNSLIQGVFKNVRVAVIDNTVKIFGDKISKSPTVKSVYLKVDSEVLIPSLDITDHVSLSEKNLNFTGGMCRWPGCISSAQPGKVYCKKHIHGS